MFIKMIKYIFLLLQVIGWYDVNTKIVNDVGIY